MLSTAAPAQVAQSVEQWTENPFQFALPLTRKNVARIARAIARGTLSIRQVRALFGVTRLIGGAR
jgi:hypothetical protein